MKILKDLLIIISILTVSCGNAAKTEQGFNQTPVITVLKPKDFYNRMNGKPGVLIDVRTPGEWKKGSIAGAKLMDIFNDSFDVKLSTLDRNETYYVYCATGGRSAEATEKMEKLGFTNVYELDGGYSAWKKEGY